MSHVDQNCGAEKMSMSNCHLNSLQISISSWVKTIFIF
jgi:hypothetical protein